MGILKSIKIQNSKKGDHLPFPAFLTVSVSSLVLRVYTNLSLFILRRELAETKGPVLLIFKYSN